MGADPWGFDEERQVLARKLVTKRRRYAWSHTGVLLVFLFVLLAGWGISLRMWADSLRLPGWAASTVFLVVLYGIGSALGWPYDYLGGYRLARGFGLSTQSARSVGLDRGKSFAPGLASVGTRGEGLPLAPAPPRR